MDLNHVRVFVRVVEEGSFTAAAEALSLPKSSVSRVVSKLEETLGVRLLQRTTRALHLTDIGRGYYERARHSLTALEEAAELAADEGSALRGTVRMSAPVDVGAVMLAEHLVAFMRDYPEVHVSLSLTGRYVDLVEEGFDLALRAGQLEDSSLVARKIGDTIFGLFASRDYLARRGEPERLSDLGEHDCVLMRGRSARRTWTLERADGRAESVQVKGMLDVDELLFVREAIEAGAGIGLLPLLVMTCCSERAPMNNLVRVLPELSLRQGALYLVTPPLELVPRRVSALRDFLIERLSSVQRDARAGLIAV